MFVNPRDDDQITTGTSTEPTPGWFRYRTFYINDKPLITGQQEVVLAAGTEQVIAPDSILITDSDDSVHTVEVLEGENYTVVSENTLLTSESFLGELIVNISVNDGTESSEVYPLVVSVKEKPVVEIQSPANNSIIPLTESLNSQALASDPDGEISRVEFKLNEGEWITDHEAPYSVDFGPMPVGSYTLYARAIDNENIASDIAINDFEIKAKVASPIFTPEAGEFEGSINVTIVTETVEATMLYRVGEQGEFSTFPQEGIDISSSSTIYAYAVKEGLIDSEIVTSIYKKPSNITVFQIDNNNLYFELNGQYFHLANINNSWVLYEIQEAEWNSLKDSFVESLYSIELGEFGGGAANDFMLLDANALLAVTYVNKGNGYQLKGSGRSVIFIHTDLLGSPVEETEHNND